jgi:hypothetical protein
MRDILFGSICMYICVMYIAVVYRHRLEWTKDRFDNKTTMPIDIAQTDGSIFASGTV